MIENQKEASQVEDKKTIPNKVRYFFKSGVLIAFLLLVFRIYDNGIINKSLFIILAGIVGALLCVEVLKRIKYFFSKAGPKNLSEYVMERVSPFGLPKNNEVYKRNFWNYLPLLIISLPSILFAIYGLIACSFENCEAGGMLVFIAAMWGVGSLSVTLWPIFDTRPWVKRTLNVIVLLLLLPIIFVLLSVVNH